MALSETSACTNPVLASSSASSPFNLFYANPARALGPGRIAVLGDTAVGKTALCLALTSGSHPPRRHCRCGHPHVCDAPPDQRRTHSRRTL